MLFRKISIKGDEKVVIKYEEPLEGAQEKDAVRDITVRCADRPHEDFAAAFIGLKRVVRYILEWPEDYITLRVTVTQVSLSHHEDTGIRGAVISGLVSLDNANAPFCFNTPHLPFESCGDNEDEPIMPPWAIDLIGSVEKEALDYLGGKRAQLAFEFAA